VFGYGSIRQNSRYGVDEAMTSKWKQVVSVSCTLFLSMTAASLGESTTIFNAAIDQWSSARQIGVRVEVRSALVTEATRAVDTVHANNPTTAKSQIQENASRAIYTYLDMTQRGSDTPSITQILQEITTGKIAPKASFPLLNYYPILNVEVLPAAPADFVVAINNNSYQAGLNTFRVLVGTQNVKVTRNSRPPCITTILITQSGPNRVKCQL
jgi:hypothetical protein